MVQQLLVCQHVQTEPWYLKTCFFCVLFLFVFFVLFCFGFFFFWGGGGIVTRTYDSSRKGEQRSLHVISRLCLIYSPTVKQLEFRSCFDSLPRLIWIQTVCKKIKVTTRGEKVKGLYIQLSPIILFYANRPSFCLMPFITLPVYICLLVFLRLQTIYTCSADCPVTVSTCLGRHA